MRWRHFALTTLFSLGFLAVASLAQAGGCPSCNAPVATGTCLTGSCGSAGDVFCIAPKYPQHWTNGFNNQKLQWMRNWWDHNPRMKSHYISQGHYYQGDSWLDRYSSGGVAGQVWNGGTTGQMISGQVFGGVPAMSGQSFVGGGGDYPASGISAPLVPPTVSGN